MAVDKAAMLAAVAQAGTAGKQAYEQAQASMAAQQAEAVRMALASGVARTPMLGRRPNCPASSRSRTRRVPHNSPATRRR